MTKTMALCGGLAAALLVPTLASAQSGETAYCAALVKKYETYLDMGSKRGRQPQSLESRVGVERCMSGDVGGIAAIEKALKDAKLDLPART